MRLHAFGYVVAMGMVGAWSLTACGGGSGGGSAANTAPTVSVGAPTEDVEVAQDVGAIVAIRYTDNDPDDNATSTVFADRDGDLATTGDQVVVAADRPEQDGTPQSVAWNTSGVAPGTYRIVVQTSDASNKAVAIGPGTVQLNAPPTIALVTPSGDVQAARAGFVLLDVVADDGDDGAVMWIYADGDGDPATLHDRHELASLVPEENGTTVSLCLSVAAVPLGRYSLIACVWDGTNAPVYATAPGALIVEDAVRAVVASGTGEEFGARVATAPDGAMTIVTNISGTTTFGAGQPGQISFATAGSSDPVLARYDKDGVLLWARHIHGPDFDQATGLTLRSDGSCVVAGEFRNTLTFGAGGPNQTIITSLGTSDLWIAHFNADGTFDWVRTAGGFGLFDGAGEIDSFADGTTIVAGRFGANCTFGPGEPNETTLAATGIDAFIARYATDGSLMWARRFGSALDDEAHSVRVLANGDFAVGGLFQGDCTFGPGETNQVTHSASGDRDAFVARHAPSGDLQWVRPISGTGSVVRSNVAALVDGGVAASVQFDGEAVFGPGEPNERTVNAVATDDFGVVRYDAAGLFEWVRHVGSSGQTRSAAIATFKNGCVLVALTTDADTTIGIGETETALIEVAADQTQGGICIDRDGNFRWAVLGEGTTGGGLFDAHVSEGGAGFLVGGFTGGVTYFAGQPNEIDLTSAGAGDSLVVRFNGDGR